MSNHEEQEADGHYEAENDRSPIPRTPPVDNSYVRETRTEIAGINPVVPDDTELEDPIRSPFSNTNEQLGK